MNNEYYTEIVHITKPWWRFFEKDARFLTAIPQDASLMNLWILEKVEGHSIHPDETRPCQSIFDREEKNEKRNLFAEELLSGEENEW